MPSATPCVWATTATSLIKETKRSGLSFHFAYEAAGNDDRWRRPPGHRFPQRQSIRPGHASPLGKARFMRDQLGLEIERTPPRRAYRARWERDLLGRPLKHEIWSGHRDSLRQGLLLGAMSCGELTGFAGDEPSREGLGTLPGFPFQKSVSR